MANCFTSRSFLHVAQVVSDSRIERKIKTQDFEEENEVSISHSPTP